MVIERPRGSKGLPVLVIHSWWGLTESFRQYCRQLAELGLVAGAADLFEGETARTEGEARHLRQKPRKTAMYRKLEENIKELVNDAAAGSESVRIVGFSMGGHWAIWLSQQSRLPVSSVVLYYSARAGDYSGSKASYLSHFAERDDWVKGTSRQRMETAISRAALPYHSFTYPGTSHWFAENSHPNTYNGEASCLALRRTVEHLRRS